MIFAERKSKNEEKGGGKNRNDGEEREKLKQSPGKHAEGGDNEEIDKLTEIKRADKFIVCFDVLGDRILSHI